VTLGRAYGSGSGPMWLDNLQCNGNESTLADCPHNGWRVTTCSEAVSIVCENGTGAGKCHGCRGNPHTHPMTREKPVGIPTEFPYQQTGESCFTVALHCWFVCFLCC